MLRPHLSHIYSCLLSVISASSVSPLITSAIWCHVFINWTSEFKNGLITLRSDRHYQNERVALCTEEVLPTHTLVLLYWHCWPWHYPFCTSTLLSVWIMWDLFWIFLTSFNPKQDAAPEKSWILLSFLKNMTVSLTWFVTSVKYFLDKFMVSISSKSSKQHLLIFSLIQSKIKMINQGVAALIDKSFSQNCQRWIQILL